MHVDIYGYTSFTFSQAFTMNYYTCFLQSTYGPGTITAVAQNTIVSGSKTNSSFIAKSNYDTYCDLIAIGF